MVWTARLLAIMAVASGLSGAATADPVASWPFDQDKAGWTSLDPLAKLDLTTAAEQIREGGGGAASFTYQAVRGKLSGMVTQVQEDGAQAKSLHFWLKTAVPTVMLVVMNEKDESSYHLAFFSLGGAWQEISLDFADFALGEDSQDENGQFDPAQLAGVGLVDAAGMLAEMAAKISFINPPTLGPRQFWLDDFSLDSENVATRWEKTQLHGRPALRLDSFEGLPLQWLMLAGDGVKVAYDDQVHADGELSLSLTYDVPQGKIFGLLTNPGKAPLGNPAVLHLALRTARTTTLIVGLKEKDGSQYNAFVPLEASPNLQEKDLNWADFKLADDGQDENGRLDAGQIVEVTIGDVSQLLGKPTGLNTLWVDDIVFGE